MKTIKFEKTERCLVTVPEFVKLGRKIFLSHKRKGDRQCAKV